MAKNYTIDNKVLMVFVIIFILIGAYFLVISSELVNDGTSLFQEQSIAGGAGIAGMTKALAYFTISTQQMRDAAKYGVYIISPDRYKSSNKLTCLKKAGTSRTPCYYYECPSNYRGEKRINLVPNRNNKCLYIKYPTNLKYSN